MAIDKRLQVFDSEGNPVDYDILASDVKFLPDGKDLPTKLGELEEEIGSGGYTPPQGGIPATDLAPAVQTSLGKAETAYQKPASGIPASDIAPGVIPDVSQLATKSEVYDKTTADGRYVQKESGKDLSTNDYTNADKTKLANIAAGAEVNVIDGIIVGNTEVQPVNKKVTIPAGQDGITPHVGQNGNWYIGNTDTNVPAQGPKGNSVADGDTFEIVNNLEDGGEADALSAQMGINLRNNIEIVQANIETLLAAMAKLAFVGDVPTLSALTWPQKPRYNINGILAGCKMATGSSTIVIEGSTATIILEPTNTDFFTLNGVTAVVTGASASDVSQVYDSTNDTLIITIANVQSTIEVSATAAYLLDLTLTVNKITAGANINGTTLENQSMTISNDVQNTGCYIDAPSENDAADVIGIVSIPQSFGLWRIAVTKDGVDVTTTAYDHTTHKLTIADASQSTIVVTLTIADAVAGMFVGRSYVGKIGNNTSGVLVEDSDWCCMEELVKVPSGATKMRWNYGASATIDSGNVAFYRRNLMFYDNALTPAIYWTIATGTQREYAPSGGIQSNYKAVRASFPKAGLADASIEFYVNGAWQTAWSGANRNINTNNNE